MDINPGLSQAADKPLTTDPITGELLVEEATLRTLVQSLLDVIGVLKDVQRTVPYPRDPSGQLRIIVGNTLTNNSTTQWGVGNNNPIYYTAGAPAAMDTREMQSEVAEMKFNAVRMGRWVFS